MPTNTRSNKGKAGDDGVSDQDLDEKKDKMSKLSPEAPEFKSISTPQQSTPLLLDEDATVKLQNILSNSRNVNAGSKKSKSRFLESNDNYSSTQLNSLFNSTLDNDPMTSDEPQSSTLAGTTGFNQSRNPRTLHNNDPRIPATLGNLHVRIER